MLFCDFQTGNVFIGPFLIQPSIWVFLIAGLKYGMEQWNGKWNGTVNVHSYS